MPIRTPAIIAGVAFILLAAAFNGLDLYDRLFYVTNQADGLAYSAARLLFVAFLFEITFALGQLPLAQLRRRKIDFALAPEEELVLALVCGSAILRFAMLVLGFADLYYWWIAAPAGAVTVAFGWSRFTFLSRAFLATSWQAAREANVVERLCVALIGGVTLYALGAVVAEKTLLPNGTGDFYTHYAPYMRHVIESHNLWPNEVWYHFYSSKALGESFFAMLISGPLGMQAASCCMFLVALLVMYAFVAGSTGDRLVALAAVAVTAMGMIWTVGMTEWGEFSKEHVITAAVFFGCVWASWRARTVPPVYQRSWAALVSLAYCGLIVLRVELLPVVLAVLFALGAWELVRRRRDRAVGFALQLGVVAATAVAVLAFNYAVTGLAEVTPFRLFWAFADQARFAHWVSPFVMMMLQLGSNSEMGTLTAPALGQSTPGLLYQILHVDRAAPFVGPLGITFAAAVVFAAWALIAGKAPRRSATLAALAVLAVMVLAAGAAALVTLSQYVSIYRLYMFCMLPIVALAALPFAVARKALGGIGAVLIGLVVTAQVVLALPGARTPEGYRKVVDAFALARLSIANADFLDNALSPPKLAMARAAHGAPIWDSEIGQYCAAPECRFETFFSFSMGPDWHTIAFGTPDEAEAALKREGLNYFAIETNERFFDVLPYAPLFSPANIERRFSLVWARDGTYLLTWRTPGLPAVPAAFFPGYEQSKKLATATADFQGMYDVLDLAYRQWIAAGRTWPIHVPAGVALPRGWQ